VPPGAQPHGLIGFQGFWVGRGKGFKGLERIVVCGQEGVSSVGGLVWAIWVGLQGVVRMVNNMNGVGTPAVHSCVGGAGGDGLVGGVGMAGGTGSMAAA
jgi:hypothetical protein